MAKEREIKIFSQRVIASNDYDLHFSTHLIAPVIFLLALAERIILTWIFWKRFGIHSSQCIEVWFFYGISRGTIEGSFSDPTVVILSLLGFLVPQDYLSQATMLLGAILSSLATVLIFFLGKEIHGKKLGVTSALLYSAMTSPLYYGTTCFVHDSVQLPIFISTLITFLLALKGSGKRRVFWGITSAFLFFLGTLVNIVIYIVLDIVAIVLFWEIIRRFTHKSGFPEMRIYAIFIGAVLLFALIVRLEILPPLFDRILSYLPQGRAGTLDIAPLSAERTWMKYNLLLFFLPFGAWKCFRRKDNVTFTLLLVSFLVSTLIMRATRLLDIGIALAMAHGFLSWKKKETLLFPFFFILLLFYITLEASPFFDFRIVTLQTAIRAIFSSNILSAITTYIALCLLFLAALSFMEEKKAQGAILFVFIVFGVWSEQARFTPVQFASFGTTEAEYNAYVFLSEKEKKTVYVFWDHAYFAQSVSGMVSISNHKTIDTRAEEAMLLDEDEAASYFSIRGVEYLVITTRDANIYASRLSWQKDASETLLFKLMREQKSLLYFQEIFYEKDEKTGIVVRIFELLKLPLNSLQ